MNDQNQRGFFGIIISKEILEEEDLTVCEKFIYGYIASFTKCCFESNERIASKLGVSESVVAHAIPKLVSKGFLFVEKIAKNSANRRIYSVFDNPKKLAYLAKKGMFDEYVKPVENSEGGMQNLHGGMQNLQTPLTGVPNAKFADIEKEEIKNKVETEQKPNNSAGLAGGLPAGRIKPTDFGSDSDYEKEFYRRNTMHLGAG